jgi:hypothetical protein
MGSGNAPCARPQDLQGLLRASTTDLHLGVKQSDVVIKRMRSNHAETKVAYLTIYKVGPAARRSGGPATTLFSDRARRRIDACVRPRLPSCNVFMLELKRAGCGL